ncbi:peptidoglycan-binding protein, partial [Amylibacter sp.]|nr:peptidoglycan-binding protein [Amylibacter sp.]
MRKIAGLLILSLIIMVSYIGSVIANTQFNGNYNSKFQFQMGPSSVCPWKLPIEIDLQISDQKIVGLISNDGGRNTNPFCKLYHNGNIKGSIDYNGKITSLLVKQKDPHSSTYSSYKIEGKIGGALSLLSRQPFFHPMHKFSLKKLKPANRANKNKNVKARLFVSVNNGTDLNYKNTEYINATVYFNDMDIDGTPHGNPSIRLKVERTPGKNAKYSMILSSRRTYLPITKKNNRGGGQGMDGYKYWLTIGKPFLLSTLARDFNERQTKALKSMCGFLSSSESIEINIQPIIDQRKNGMKKSIAGLANKQTYLQWAQLAKMCSRALNGKIKGYETVSLENLKKNYVNKKLCGIKTYGINLDTTTFKLIQRKLKQLDFYESDIDGLFGNTSCQALKKYLADKNRLNAAKFTKLTLGMLIKDA